MAGEILFCHMFIVVYIYFHAYNHLKFKHTFLDILSGLSIQDSKREGLFKRLMREGLSKDCFELKLVLIFELSAY